MNASAAIPLKPNSSSASLSRAEFSVVAVLSRRRDEEVEVLGHPRLAMDRHRVPAYDHEAHLVIDGQ